MIWIELTAMLNSLGAQRELTILLSSEWQETFIEAMIRKNYNVYKEAFLYGYAKSGLEQNVIFNLCLVSALYICICIFSDRKKGELLVEYLSQYLYAQLIAKTTMSEIKGLIKEGISEREIVFKTEDIMKNKGINRFWYHGVGAFVHVGKRTAISESGKDYKPSDTLVGRNDIVTVDLSPEVNTYWGDYARTFIVMDGNVMEEDALVNGKNECEVEFSNGIKTEVELHKVFTDIAKPDMTFEEVYLYMNEVIEQLDYSNLDFSGNLGHTIEFNKDNRRYFELGNEIKLSEVSFFTFEPHIKHRNGEYGFKREDIYYFRNGELFVL